MSKGGIAPLNLFLKQAEFIHSTFEIRYSGFDIRFSGRPLFRSNPPLFRPTAELTVKPDLIWIVNKQEGITGNTDLFKQPTHLILPGLADSMFHIFNYQSGFHFISRHLGPVVFVVE